MKLLLLILVAISTGCGDTKQHARGKEFPRAYCWRHTLFLIYEDGSNYEIRNIRCEDYSDEKKPS